MERILLGWMIICVSISMPVFAAGIIVAYLVGALAQFLGKYFNGQQYYE